MSWWTFWKTELPTVAPETRRKSTTAMLDEVIAQVEAQQDARTQEVQVASRRAATASRKVVIRTGMHLAQPNLPSEPPEPDQT